MKRTTMIHAARLVTGSMLTLACLKAGAQTKEPPVFRWLENASKPGDTIHAVYRPHVPDSTKVKGYVYFYTDFQWRGYDLPLKKTDSGWLVQQVIPQGAAMIDCRFYLNDTVDRGGRFPYVMLLRDKDNKMAPGSYTEYALMRRKTLSGMILPLASPESEIEPKVAVQLYISRDWSNMTVRRRRFYEMAKALKEYLPPGKTDTIVRQGAAEIAALPDVTEKELISIRKVYSYLLNDRTGSDSIGKLILAKYPEGLTYRLSQVMKINSQRDKATRIALWDDFMKKYPAAQYPYEDYLDPVYGDASYFANCFTGRANLAFTDHDLATLTKMIKDVPTLLLPYFYTHYVIYPFRQQKILITEKEAYTLGKVYMAEMMKRIYSADVNVSGRGIYAAGEWPDIWMRQVDARESMVHHVKLLYDNGDYAEAAKYARIIQPVVKLWDVSVNDVYVKMLIQAKKQSEAVAYVKAAIHANTVTPDMINVLKTAYTRQHGNTKGFAEYVVSLKSPETIEKEHEAIRKTMINTPCPAFDLLDTHGNRVSLASQKGKIVILDFWATWCYYCKLAMPGMQMAVEHYKEDKDVAFYFIATLEQDPRYKQMIDSFITAKKYDFTVLYDANREGGERPDKTYEDFRKVFHFNGIPEKAIIDQNGNVRWTSSGGTANHIALAEELTYIIDLLKKENDAKVASLR